ncbi:MAG: hypothetical protein ABWK53_04500 [Anaerolineales bacterium]
MPPEPGHGLLSPFRKKRQKRNFGFKKTLLRDCPNPSGNGWTKGWRGDPAISLAGVPTGRAANLCAYEGTPRRAFLFGGQNVRIATQNRFSASALAHPAAAPLWIPALAGEVIRPTLTGTSGLPDLSFFAFLLTMKG